MALQVAEHLLVVPRAAQDGPAEQPPGRASTIAAHEASGAVTTWQVDHHSHSRQNLTLTTLLSHKPPTTSKITLATIMA